jgi:ribosome-associated translation inhibitor RaiA
MQIEKGRHVEVIDARGEFPLTRIAVVKKWYKQRYGWSEADVITNILKPYKCEAITNYSKLNLKSIMV